MNTEPSLFLMLTPDLSKVSPTYNVPVLIDAENGLDLN